MIDFQMYPLGAALALEDALIEAVKERRAFTSIGFEDGMLLAFVETVHGSFWQRF